MSEWKVQVVRLGKLEKHSNADKLMVTQVFGYPVITAIAENYQEGDLAVYVPVDSVVPADDPRWAFLQGHLRIKAKKLRGVFSMGLLTKAEPEMAVGEVVSDYLKIVKYEPPENATTGGEAEKCPFEWPKYTDIEALRRWPDILKKDEEVYLSEKVHGTSARYTFRDGRIWVGSHREVKKENKDSVYWKPVFEHNLAERLAKFPNIAIYGEVYGWVQDLRYGHTPGKVSLRLFDAMDLTKLQYLDLDPFLELAEQLGLPVAPLLYRGPWDPTVVAPRAEGKTMLGGDHVKEGVVIRPVKERFDERVGRVCLKYHGEGYLLRA